MKSTATIYNQICVNLPKTDPNELLYPGTIIVSGGQAVMLVCTGNGVGLHMIGLDTGNRWSDKAIPFAIQNKIMVKRSEVELAISGWGNARIIPSGQARLTIEEVSE